LYAADTLEFQKSICAFLLEISHWSTVGKSVHALEKPRMKTKHQFLLPLLIAVFGLMPTGPATAQTLTVLHSFTATNGVAGTNGDGATPYAGLILSGHVLYGATYGGGNAGKGSVFAVNTDGTGFTNLHSFTARFGPALTNIDGARPEATLILSGNTLYGTAPFAGSSGIGTVFAVNTDGTGFTNLHNFSGGSDGFNPYAGLILSSNTLYGTSFYGGNSGAGTIFSISMQPQLTIIPSGANVILTWPTNYAGFTLQSATNLVSPAWTTNSPAPVIVNGQNTVTNPISGTQQFYRLSQ